MTPSGGSNITRARALAAEVTDRDDCGLREALLAEAVEKLCDELDLVHRSLHAAHAATTALDTRTIGMQVLG